MKHNRRSSRRSGRDVTPRAEDVLDESISESSGSKARRNQKDRQLCRQAFRTLSFALAGGCGDDVLADFVVRAVLPAPDAGRLMVCLEPGGASPVNVDLDEVLARLERVKPRLRRELAGAIVRKRTPDLEFVVMPRGEVRP